MDIVEELSNIPAMIVMFLISFVLMVIIIYIFVEYVFFKKKLTNLAPNVASEYVTTQEQKYYTEIKTKSGDISISKDTKYALMSLMTSAINALKSNYKIFSQINFYTQPIDQLISKNQWYIPVLKFTKFCYITPTINNETLDQSIEYIYGSHNSQDLFVNINGIDYYLPLEFDPAMQLYVKNKDYLDKIITI
jgi:hypothetical protein